MEKGEAPNNSNDGGRARAWHWWKRALSCLGIFLAAAYSVQLAWAVITEVRPIETRQLDYGVEVQLKKGVSFRWNATPVLGLLLLSSSDCYRLETAYKGNTQVHQVDMLDDIEFAEINVEKQDGLLVIRDPNEGKIAEFGP